MTPEEFRSAAHEVVDWIADYLISLESIDVTSTVSPGDVRASLPPDPPESPESLASVLADLDDIIVPALTHWQSPRFFAYFPANASPASVLGEFVTAGLAVNGFSWVTSPAATELETHLMDWMVELLDLPDTFIGNGVIQDSASSSTLCAALAARERSQGPRDRLVAYTTSQAHSSVEKALRIADIPSDRLRIVDHDDVFAMQADALARAIDADRAAGLEPFFVVASAGTTSSEAFDPVDEIAAVCSERGVWLHVDGAMCGIAALCPEYRWVNRGLEGVDSYVTNAHKWMGVNFDASLFWVRDRTHLLNALSILPEYLRNKEADAGTVIDYRDWQLPLGRRFRALKLWFVLRLDGVEAIRTMIRRHVALATELHEWIDADPRFVSVAPTPLNLVTFAMEAGDAATQALCEALNATHRVLVTPAVLDGRRAIRVSIGSRLTEQRHVTDLSELVSSLADEVLTRSTPT